MPVDDGFKLFPLLRAFYSTNERYERYSKVSWNLNSIHTNPYFGTFSSFSGYHYTWSAATRRYMETVVAKGFPDRTFRCRHLMTRSSEVVNTIANVHGNGYPHP